MNRDGQVTPRDALLVINDLIKGDGEGEREASVASGDAAAMWWPNTDTATNRFVATAFTVKGRKEVSRADDARQSADFLQSLDLLYAKLDEPQGTRTWGFGLGRGDTPADDLEEFLDGLLGGSADETELLADAAH